MAVHQAVDEVAAAAESALSKIEKKPIVQQILIGAISGLATGYVLAKVGKSIAFCVGVSAIGLQFVINHKQSNDDWKKIEDDTREVLGKVVPIAKQNKSFAKKVVAIFKENQVFFGSFGGGFLVGVSFS